MRVLNAFYDALPETEPEHPIAEDTLLFSAPSPHRRNNHRTGQVAPSPNVFPSEQEVI